MWAPTYDESLWRRDRLLHLFIREAERLDAEGLAAPTARMIHVLEWKPEKD
jgi:hypothetical protein